MKVSEFISKIRFDLVDQDAVEYPDTDLIEYLNRAIEFLNKELINRESNILLKHDDLSLTNGEATLPSDFVVEKAVIDSDGNALTPTDGVNEVTSTTYKIVGDTLYSDNTTLSLWYYYRYPFVSGVNSDLPVKDYMIDLLKEMVIFIALNRNEFNTTIEQALTDEFSDQVLRITGVIGFKGASKRVPYVL